MVFAFLGGFAAQKCKNHPLPPFLVSEASAKRGRGMAFAFLGGEAAQKCKNHLLRGFFVV